MSYQLRLDEILDALSIAGHPRAAEFRSTIETITTTMANELAALAGVDCDAASFQGTAFAGTCVPFMPKYEGQPLPEILEGYDNEEEWGA